MQNWSKVAQHGLKCTKLGWLSLKLKSWPSGRGWGQQLFSFRSPAVHWMAQTSSLNLLSLHWMPPPFHNKISLVDVSIFFIFCPFGGGGKGGGVRGGGRGGPVLIKNRGRGGGYATRRRGRGRAPRGECLWGGGLIFIFGPKCPPSIFFSGKN